MEGDWMRIVFCVNSTNTESAEGGLGGRGGLSEEKYM